MCNVICYYYLFTDLPPHAPYLIIGAGTAAFAAYRAIRATDAKAQVLLYGTILFNLQKY